VLASPLLEVREIAVSGTSTIPASAVQQAAAVRTGVPLARIDADSVRRQVASLPQVAAVDVDRSWPHTLRLTVRERSPVAVLHARGSTRLVDASGMAYAAASPEAARAGRTLPEMRADPGGGGTARARRAGGAAVLAALPEQVRSRVDTVEVADNGRVSLLLEGRRTVSWGDPADSARKSEVLLALLPRAARFFDVSSPDAPATG
jgi:cell division protein FtsQ